MLKNKSTQIARMSTSSYVGYPRNNERTIAYDIVGYCTFVVTWVSYVGTRTHPSDLSAFIFQHELTQKPVNLLLYFIICQGLGQEETHTCTSNLVL